MGTSLNSMYGRGQLVYALSPQINIPENEILNISFLLAYKFGQNPFDGSNLMYSTNLKNWSVLGTSSDGGLNWYNRISILELSNINDPSFPETPPSGWGYIENQNNWNWSPAYHIFPNLNGQNCLWLRFILATSLSLGDFGIVIDNLQLSIANIPLTTTILPTTTTTVLPTTTNSLTTTIPLTSTILPTTINNIATTTHSNVNISFNIPSNNISTNNSILTKNNPSLTTTIPKEIQITTTTTEKTNPPTLKKGITTTTSLLKKRK